jgi:type IV pilus assembly protein PilW
MQLSVSPRYRPHTNISSHQTAGFTLMEIMVALGLTLLLAAIGASVYSATRSTNRLQDDVMAMQEAGAISLELLGKHIRMAGAPQFPFNGQTGWVLSNFIGGADAGGSDGKSDVLRVRYDSDGYDAATRVGGDCMGNAPDPADGRTIAQLFFIENKKLYCALQRDPANRRIMLDNVEDFQVRFGVANPASANPESTTQYKIADSSMTTQDWETVRSVQVCLVLSTTATATKNNAPVNSANPATFIDCEGQTQPSTDGRIRKAMSTVINLRNTVRAPL